MPLKVKKKHGGIAEATAARKAPANHTRVDVNSKEFREAISTELGYIMTMLNPAPDPTKPFEWADFQYMLFGVQGSTSMNKCRQSGGSYAVAARVTARAMLMNKDYAIIITSIKKDEAQNKIGYIESFISSIPPRYRRKIKYSNKFSIEIENADGSTVKIISHAQKESRGLHGDHVFDEFDFYKDPELLYSAALPGTKRVGGRIDIITTPWNPFGFFRKIMDPKEFPESAGKYSQFTKMKIPWWTVPSYTNPKGLEIVLNKETGRKRRRAAMLAPSMATEERVYTFGTPLLIEAYENTTFDSFRREYEAVFIHSNNQFFSPDSITLSVCRDYYDLVHEDYSRHWNEDVDDTGYVSSLTPIESVLLSKDIRPNVYGDPEDEMSIEELGRAITTGDVSMRLYAGADIGRTKDATDFVIYEEISIDGVSYLIERFWLKKTGWKLDEQQQYFEMVLKSIPLIKFGMDTNGLGSHMGDYFSTNFPGVFQAFPFSSYQAYESSMGALKRRFTTRTIGISSYIEVQSAFGGVYRDGADKDRPKWILSRKHGGHSDAAVSRGIVAALCEQHTTLNTGYNRAGVGRFSFIQEREDDNLIQDPFDDPIFSKTKGGIYVPSRLTNELDIGDVKI